MSSSSWFRSVLILHPSERIGNSDVQQSRVPDGDAQQPVIGCQQNIRTARFCAGRMEGVNAGKPKSFQFRRAGCHGRVTPDIPVTAGNHQAQSLAQFRVRRVINLQIHHVTCNS